MLSFEGGHANLCAHGGLRYGDWNYAVQVVAFANEEGMFFYVKDNV